MDNTNAKANTSDMKYIFIFIGILSSIFIAFILIAIASYTLFFKNLDFNKMFEEESEQQLMKPTKKLPKVNVIKESTSSTTNTVLTTTTGNTPTTTQTKTTTVVTKPQNTQTKVTVKTQPPCYKYKVGDPFNKTKCYTYKDYGNLQYYYNSYIGINNQIPYIKNAIDMTCDGSDFFANSCKRNKEELKQTESRKNNYEKKILSIISKGK